LSEYATFDVHPAPIQRLGAGEPLHLDDCIGMIDDQLVAAAILNGTDFAPDDAVGAAEEIDHARCIGAVNPCNRGKFWLRAPGSRLQVPKSSLVL
jgi:hypothetical protein